VSWGASASASRIARGPSSLRAPTGTGDAHIAALKNQLTQAARDGTVSAGSVRCAVLPVIPRTSHAANDQPTRANACRWSADPPQVRRKKEAELQRRRGLWRPTVRRSAEGTTATLVPLARHSTCRLCPNYGSESCVGDPAANHLSQVWESAGGSISAGSVNNARRYPAEITTRRRWSWSRAALTRSEGPVWVEPSRSERGREDLQSALLARCPRPREGPLTEPIAGAQPRQQERILMPYGQPQCSTDENGRLSHQTLFH
jgi:hypothetical protein